MSLLPVKNKVRCPRCDKPATHLVKTHWGGNYGALCPACCQKAVKKFDKDGWPLFPDGRDLPEPKEGTKVLDAEAAVEGKRDGMERVEVNADPEWKQDALLAVGEVAWRLEEFTSDDIWATGLPKPAEARALGPILMQAAKKGWCEKTGRSRPTSQASRHATDVAIWRSKLIGATVAPTTTEE